MRKAAISLAKDHSDVSEIDTNPGKECKLKRTYIGSFNRLVKKREYSLTDVILGSVGQYEKTPKRLQEFVILEIKE